MDDKTYKVIHEFWLKRSNKKDFLWRDLANLNYDCIKPHLAEDKIVLDLGAGDCATTILVANKVKHVTAVDYAPVIKTVNHPKISVVCCPVESYNDCNKYDVIIIFGVMNYIHDPEKMYRKCKEQLAPDGVLLIKHQCAKENDYEVSTDVDGDRYIALYRHYKFDIDTLSKVGFKVDVTDPYPLEYNVWPNTFFKLFTCTL